MTADRIAVRDHGSVQLRWPRYSEHPWLQRARTIAAIAGALVFLTALIFALT